MPLRVVLDSVTLSPQPTWLESPLVAKMPNGDAVSPRVEELVLGPSTPSGSRLSDAGPVILEELGDSELEDLEAEGCCHTITPPVSLFIGKDSEALKVSLRSYDMAVKEGEGGRSAASSEEGRAIVCVESGVDGI